MQMAKTNAALTRLAKKGLPYISVLTDPTMGGRQRGLCVSGRHGDCRTQGADRLCRTARH